jgi:hypothetical protein
LGDGFSLEHLSQFVELCGSHTKFPPKWQHWGRHLLENNREWALFDEVHLRLAISGFHLLKPIQVHVEDVGASKD